MDEQTDIHMISIKTKCIMLTERSSPPKSWRTKSALPL